MQSDKEIEMKRERDQYVDVAKGLSILLIVAIHTEVFGKIGNPLAFIAVPVFFFMSGFYDHSERGWNDWLPKALKTLILPAVIWVVLVTVYIQFLGFLKDRSWGVIFHSTGIILPVITGLHGFFSLCCMRNASYVGCTN